MVGRPRVYGEPIPKSAFKYRCKECRKKYIGKSFLKDRVCIVCKVEAMVKDKQRENLRKMREAKE